MADRINVKGWHFLNGCTEGDWEGEYTYVSVRGCSVIDYVIVNDSVQERVLEFRIGSRVDSDHQPLTLTLKTEEENKSAQRTTRRTEQEEDYMLE